MRKKLISIVIPCFNEEENVKPAYVALKDTAKKLKNYHFEYVFVDNGSTDKTRKNISFLIKKDRSVVGVYLTRNFGPESSIQAGLDRAKGNAVIVYECDMQDPPALIRDFIAQWEEGYEIVAGIRTKIDDEPLMTFFRTWFYKIFKMVSDIEVPVNSGSYGLIGRKALDTMKHMPEKFRFFRGLRAWVGYKTAYVTYERKKRERGKSSYNLFGYFKHAERSFFGFSYLPLDVLVYGGFFIVICSFIAILIYAGNILLTHAAIDSSVAIIMAVVFFGGIQLLALSMIGKYIQVIMEETKGRPTYIIEKIEKSNK